MNPELLCEANKEGRVITFFIREKFGDGTDGGGLAIGKDQERKHLHKVLDQAIDAVTGRGPRGLRDPAAPIERWVRIRHAASEHEVSSRD